MSYDTVWMERAAQAQLEAETARGLLDDVMTQVRKTLTPNLADRIDALLAQPTTASPLAEENGRLREALRKSRLFVNYSNFSAGYQDDAGKSRHYTSEEVLAEIDALLAQPAPASPLAEENGRLRGLLKRSQTELYDKADDYNDIVRGEWLALVGEIDAVLAAWPSTVAGGGAGQSEGDER